MGMNNVDNDDESRRMTFSCAENEIVSGVSRLLFEMMTAASKKVLTYASVYGFVATVYAKAQLTIDAPITALIFITRLLTTCYKDLTVHNFKAIVLTGIMLSAKVVDDYCMYNSAFAEIAGVSLEHLNVWEIDFLKNIQYNIQVDLKEYAKIYNDIVSMNLRDTLRHHNTTTTNTAAGGCEKLCEMFDAYEMEETAATAQSKPSGNGKHRRLSSSSTASCVSIGGAMMKGGSVNDREIH